MLTTRQRVFRKFWHAVMPLHRLQGGQPQPFTLLGEAIVLFLDAQGRPAALKDRCCHRTAKLSKGRCVDGALQCGYHGWTYDGSGRVIRIPQYEPERPIPADYCTPAYRCQARYGYAWVALVAPDEEPLAPIPDMPEYGAPGWRTIFQFHETWATSPLRALENSFDNSHFSFVHRATFGVAAQPRPSRYELVPTEGGFYAETVIAATNPPAYQRVSGSTEPLTQRHMRNAYYLPFARRLDIEYPGVDGAAGRRHVILNSFTPIDDGHIQLCQWLFRNDTEADCPEALLVEFDAVITREDKDILESTDPDALVDTRRRGVERSMDSDRPGMLIRKLLMELLAAHGEAEVHR
ncbi:MAG: aromatic ring-hydroxylating dioxygenase subunit alpha [Burkholderiales bacterium]|nr:aromatic ring-hydroxylating dioxygenase subunit alpha [Burkholderiales bacterium]MDE2274897.1 aromatic ring-hydroxylating dioxygenase subunit alpha [Burkholderiales bacterium]